MSDLQAAAERLRKHISRRPGNPSPYAKQDKKGEAYFDSGEMEFDTFKTSRAFLALTDPTPIDEAWIKSIAPCYWQAGREYTWPGTPLRWAAKVANGCGAGREGFYLDAPTGPHYLDHITTRGAVNSLLNAIKGG